MGWTQRKLPPAARQGIPYPGSAFQGPPQHEGAAELGFVEVIRGKLGFKPRRRCWGLDLQTGRGAAATAELGMLSSSANRNWKIITKKQQSHSWWFERMLKTGDGFFQRE